MDPPPLPGHGPTGFGPPPPPGYGTTGFGPPGYGPPPGPGPAAYSYGPAIGYGYPQWIGSPPWKGAQFGRPMAGPGSLAHPGSRLAARIIDGLVLLPVSILVIGGFVALVGSSLNSGSGSGADPVGLALLLEFGFYGLVFFQGALQVLYETVAIGRYGRTLGKAWLHIRPLCEDGSGVTMTRAFFRSLCTYVAMFISCFGLLDPLWCLWDPARQCLHDKIAGTIVVND